MNETSEVIHIGEHVCRYEPPDVVFWKLVGPLSEAEMRRLYSEVDAIAAHKDYLLMFVDLSSVGTVAAGARKASIEQRSQKGRGAAIVGASVQLRIVANFVIRAASLVVPHAVVPHADFPIRFFATEMEARGWLAQRRAVALGQRVQPSRGGGP